MRRVGGRRGESRRALMAEITLTSGHEPSINSRRNWSFVYTKRGADRVGYDVRLGAVRVASDEQRKRTEISHRTIDLYRFTDYTRREYFFLARDRLAIYHEEITSVIYNTIV